MLYTSTAQNPIEHAGQNFQNYKESYNTILYSKCTKHAEFPINFLDNKENFTDLQC